MSDRDWHIRMARTFLHQAAVVRRQGIHHGWHATLLRWAADRRLQARQVIDAPVAIEPTQLGLFDAMTDITS